MTTRLFHLAFAAGALVLLWIGAGFVGTSPLAAAITALIAAVFATGAWELRQFRRDSTSLDAVLNATTEAPASLAEWLQAVPPVLRDGVRSRVQGERGALPGAALTPYLVGLLVMLGMLGTFLGMVITFKGTVFALEGAADLQAMRSALAAPIRGLGLSFGTSVAGVAASAMLGLMAAIARRERLGVARKLEARIADVLLPLSLVHQRQESFRAIGLQAQVLPDVALKLDALMARIERRGEQLDAQLRERNAQLDAQLLERSANLGAQLLEQNVKLDAQLMERNARLDTQLFDRTAQLNTQLLEQNAALQREVAQAVERLAQEVGTSLADALRGSAQAAADAIRPVVDVTMARVAQHTADMGSRLGEVAQAQVDAIAKQLVALRDDEARRGEAAVALLAALREDEQRRGDAVMARFAQLREDEQHRGNAAVAALAALRDDEQRRGDAAVARLAELRNDEQERGDAAVARLAELQAAVTQHLSSLGAALEQPLSRLLATASEVPQAASAVITKLREEVIRLGERENATLEERNVLLEQVRQLMQAVNAASDQQRSATETLLASASTALEQAGARFGDLLDAQSVKAADTSAHIAAAAVELAAVSEAFAGSVQQFEAGNARLVEGLERLEASLRKSTARSDEQLAYYVAQAREVIDLSIASQHGLVEKLGALQVLPIRTLPPQGERA